LRQIQTEANDGHAMESAAPLGTVLSVRGAVVDVGFTAGSTLPPINTALIVEWDRPEPLILEVHSHIDPMTVRSIALQATAGLARNTKVRATGAPISVPVGDAVLGRLLDVVGTVRDRGPALPLDTPRRGIHNSPPALDEEAATSKVFETGIKVIDLLAPLAQGGKAAVFSVAPTPSVGSVPACEGVCTMRGVLISESLNHEEGQ
jgi:F-type H+/Na+-transporting ATPase subunit beta